MAICAGVAGKNAPGEGNFSGILKEQSNLGRAGK